MSLAEELIDSYLGEARLNITVSEIEHSGDEERSADDIRKSGGKIVKVDRPYADSEDGDEEATFTVEVKDKKDFLKKLAKTDTGDYM